MPHDPQTANPGFEMLAAQFLSLVDGYNRLATERNELYRCALRYRRQRNKARGEAAQLATLVSQLRMERDAAREFIKLLNDRPQVDAGKNAGYGQA